MRTGRALAERLDCRISCRATQRSCRGDNNSGWQSTAARAPRLMADEPTATWMKTAARVLDLMLSPSETGTTLLIVTHSAAVAAQMDRRVHRSGPVERPLDQAGAAS